jgi:signal transduction histidine kinase
MTLDRRVEVLRNAFPNMEDELLITIAQSACEVHVAAGDRICEEGKVGDAFYLILSGRVQVSKFLELGTQHLLNELRPGQFFGELALVEDAPRVASVHALEETTLLAITKNDFQELLADSPAMGVSIMRAVAARLRDSDRRAIEELRQKNDQLAQAYAELKDVVRRKSEFLTVVAHELRTPLTSIKGYAHLMRIGMLKGEDLYKALSVIVHNTDAIVRLINNILFLQELELIPPTLEPVDIQQLVNSLVDTMRARANDHGLNFEVTLPSDLPKVRGDLDGLAQAIGALIDNAVKFSPHGGAIKVSAQRHNSEVELAITDPGVGIPPDQIYHIFDRYHHLEAIGDHLFGGVGLGLPIARQVVEQHGGHISVVSRLGEGSTFTMTLPVFRERELEIMRE